MLREALDRYNKQQATATGILEELLSIAQEMREARKRGDTLGLSEDELAFYDALANNQSAVEVMGDEQLAFIARELIQAVRKNVSIDWTVKQGARARIRVVVKRILRRYGYPPDLQEAATRTVLAQAELLAADWSG
jgi:type I restriction enzyme R subunit